MIKVLSTSSSLRPPPNFDAVGDTVDDAICDRDGRVLDVPGAISVDDAVRDSTVLGVSEIVDVTVVENEVRIEDVTIVEYELRIEDVETPICDAESRDESVTTIEAVGELLTVANDRGEDERIMVGETRIEVLTRGVIESILSIELEAEAEADTEGLGL